MTVNTANASILLIDDEKMVRRTMRKSLEKEHYTCQEAENANEALFRLEQNPYDLAILDVKMPDKTGLELLPEINKSFPDTAVIMATAVNDINTVVQCMKLGAIDYLPKPFQPDELYHSVKQALFKRNLELDIKTQIANLEYRIGEQKKKLRNLYLDAMESLIFALEAKDKYTAGHSRRVNAISMAIARKLGLCRDDIEDVRWGSLLHDVGKIAIDSNVQNKNAPLTEDEYRHIMVHAQVGPGIVKHLTNSTVMDIIRYHHAHFDGNKPEQEISGIEIPLGARIVAVADAYDAMTSARPYRKSMSPEQAVAEIKRCSGTQFDPIIVEAFLKIFEYADNMVVSKYLETDSTSPLTGVASQGLPL